MADTTTGISNRTNFADFTSGWHPCKTVEIGTINGVKKYKYIFDSKGDITRLMLRKSIHWIAPLSLGATLVGEHAGTFEYKIFDPAGNLILWSRVTVALQLFVELVGNLIGAAIGFFVWVPAPDRTALYAPTLVDAPINPSRITTPTLPKVKQQYKTNNLEYLKEITLVYPSLPPIIGIPNEYAEHLIVEKGTINPNSNKIIWTDLGEMTRADENSPFRYSDTNVSIAEKYYYRVKATHDVWGQASGQGVSIVPLGKVDVRTIIQTFVYERKRTPYYDYLNDDEIIPEEEASLAEGVVNPSDFVWFPQKREETLLLNPASGTDFTINEGLIDTWWYGPVYDINVPSGSELHIVRDGFSSGNFSQRGRSAEWQFKYELGSLLWGVVREISGQMLSAQVRNNSVHVISGGNPNSLYDINSDRTLIILEDSNSAFIYLSPQKEIYVCVYEKSAYKLYVSTNKGITFNKKQYGDKDLILFDNNGGYKVIDIIKTESNIVYVLAENGDGLYYQSSIDNYDEIRYIGQKKSGNTSYVWNFTRAIKGEKEYNVIGQNHKYISNNTIIWRESLDL